jgi:D-amino-acid dehydrogenase
MKLAIAGAGIIGITTAWELAQDGHEVTVFERRGAAAEESSFANAGVVAPGYVTPWAAPGMPWKVAKHLVQRHAPVTLGAGLLGRDLAWATRWFVACNAKAYATNRSRMQQLARYSKERLHAVADAAAIEFERSQGYMVLLRSAADRKMVQASLQVLKDAGVGFTELDEDGARQVEPALNADTRFHGAVHLPEDEVGNCRQFALLLKNAAQSRGVRFEFGVAIDSIEVGAAGSKLAQSASQVGGVTLQVRDAGAPSAQPQVFDAVVISAGVDSRKLLAPLGVAVPVAPVYGYSISAHVKEPINAPRSGVMDERYKVAISRLGQRVRVAGSAELGGRAGHLDRAALRTLYKVLQDWFPGAAVMSHGVQEWKGARPMLPDGPPLVGASGVPGVWLNLGHGSSGWALSCGSARLVADLLGGRVPAVDAGGFGLERFKQ